MSLDPGPDQQSSIHTSSRDTLWTDVQDCTKYFGVDLHWSLSWKPHMDRITKKANSTFGFLRRKLKAGTKETKANAYFCMVRSNLEYCCSVWSPHNTDLTKKVEMVQRRAARFTINRYGNTSSLMSMLDLLKWETLEARRAKIQLSLLYKVYGEEYRKPFQNRE